MKTTSSGFTLIELIVMCAIMAIIAAVSIPNLVRSRIAANESTTVGSLTSLATQEALFKHGAKVDQNANGVGEYGLLGEMAGEICLRPSTARLLNPPYVSQHFRTSGSASAENGTALKSGYRYSVYLSTDGAQGAANDKDLAGDATTGGAAANINAMNYQESSFALYAWPTEFRTTGARAFFINEVGLVYATKMEAKTYDGVLSIPAANAAYINASRVFKSRISFGDTAGADGNQWYPTGG